MTDDTNDYMRWNDHMLYLWAIDNGDNGLADLWLRKISRQLWNGEILNEFERKLVAHRLTNICRNDEATKFWLGGRTGSKNTTRDMLLRHLQAYVRVNFYIKQGMEMWEATDIAASELGYCKEGQSNDESDAGMKSLKHDYQQGQKKMKKYRGLLETSALAAALWQLYPPSGPPESPTD